MRRRAFLRDSALISAGICEMFASHADAQPPVSPSAATIHVVGAGDDRYGQRRTLGFGSISFKVGTADTDGRLFIIEHPDMTPGGPPLHMHPHQEEWFYVLDGKVAFQVGEQRMTLGPGESVLGPRGVPHTFSSVGAKPSRLLIAFSPAGEMEMFFREVRDPHMRDPAVWRQYGVELIGPSPFWT
jgi:mannose-6-phosphate isomerase-like protein (cupin superfamily)